jgi:hypothetical protein
MKGRVKSPYTARDFFRARFRILPTHDRKAPPVAFPRVAQDYETVRLCNQTIASFVSDGEYDRRGVKMNSKQTATVSAGRTLRTAIIALAGAFALTTMTGCFASPRANDTLAGAAIGAGGGALIGGAEGSPLAGAVIGGLGGGAVGYIVGSEMQNRGYNRGYYPGGF